VRSVGGAGVRTMGDKRAPILSGAVVVGDSATHEALISPLLSGLASQVVWTDDVGGAQALVRSAKAELVLVTQDVSPGEGLAFVRRMQETCPDAAVVVVSDGSDVDLTVQLVRAGAYDVLAGPLNRHRLRRLIEGMTVERVLADENRQRFFCDQCPPGLEIAGRSQGIVQALEMIRLVAESRCNPILVTGETGTGKELAARAVHAWRFGDPQKFVAINCAALTANLLESELFGHVRGAFTGAERAKTGLFELAGSGSVFLDEISEMPVDLQAKLLRVLQNSTFRKVGGVTDIHCNATIIASSNRDLLAEVGGGRFRKDLYYRLAVFPIFLPPLRGPQRRSDIPLLAEYFLATSSVLPSGQAKSLSPEAGQILLAHDWPGNVRELRNVIERAMILAKGEQITGAGVIIDSPSALPRLDGWKGEPGKEFDPSDFSLKAAERELIIRALKQTGWQRTRAAALLGITRATLHDKIIRYQIEVPISPYSPTKRAPGRPESGRDKNSDQADLQSSRT